MTMVKIDGQNIEIISNNFGQEVVKYNGEEVSSKFSIMGATHIFTVSESGAAAIYEVKLKNSWHGMSVDIQIKKNGSVSYTGEISNIAGSIGWIIAISIFAVPYALNPSKDKHYAAMTAEFQKEHPIVSEFTPDSLFESMCKYNDYFFFSETKYENKTCTIGFFGKVIVKG
jgi:hypothetical protein